MTQQAPHQPLPQPAPAPGTAPIIYPPTDPAGTSAAWGAAGTPRPGGKLRWTRKNTALAIGVAVVVAGGGAAAVHAAAGSAGTTSASGQLAGGQALPGGGTGSGTGGGTGAGAMMGGAGLATALHGEYVVSDGGSYVTMLTQTGEITAVSATSLTVKSADGVSLSYALGTSTTVSKADTSQSTQGGPPGAGSVTQGSLTDLAVGTTVRVSARKDATENSAETVVITTAGQ
ncbi:hypothetical protein [Arthrobacter sp. ERGS1:01]|uniref:hypothetical protein n=1 Tax=Arthrobacter sp. ERGS1:01 TaxID=1704044 RepID=UPI0006B4A491|nr:hypothetical protein [Arthrobacter sp. ERGS1:01]